MYWEVVSGLLLYCGVEVYWEVVSGLLLYCGVWRCIGRWLVAYCCTVGWRCIGRWLVAYCCTVECGGVLGGG